MSDGPIEPDLEGPPAPSKLEPKVIRPAIVTSAEEALRLKKAGAFDRPTSLGSVTGETLNAAILGSAGGVAGEALKAGVLGLTGVAGTKLDLGGLVTGAEKSQVRIAAITKAMREPISLATVGRVPSPEVVAMQGIREAIADQGELLGEQVAQTIRIAALQADSSRAQAAANEVLTWLTAALVVFTSVLVFEPAHAEPVGLAIGLAISAVLARGTIRAYAARARRRLRRRSGTA